MLIIGRLYYRQYISTGRAVAATKPLKRYNFPIDMLEPLKYNMIDWMQINERKLSQH